MIKYDKNIKICVIGKRDLIYTCTLHCKRNLTIRIYHFIEITFLISFNSTVYQVNHLWCELPIR